MLRKTRAMPGSAPRGQSRFIHLRAAIGCHMQNKKPNKSTLPPFALNALALILIVFMGMGLRQVAVASDVENVVENAPTGFFTKLTLAHGYQAVKDVFQTDRYKPEKPASTFKSDVDTIYLVFDLLPRENPAHIIGQLYLDKGDGRSKEELLEEEEVYLTTSQDSGFIEFSRPPGGWIPGNYKLKLHLGEKVTQASQIGTLRFKIVPTT